MKKKYIEVATKVSPEVYVQLNRIAKAMGLSVYAIGQMSYETIVRYMDDQHNLSERMEKAMSIFEHLEGWRNALNLADPFVKLHIGEAVYFLYDEEGKKQGGRAILVQKPFMGNWQQTANIQTILERVICVIYPERYRKLRLLAVEYDCSSILELIDTLIDNYTKDRDLKYIRQQFEDAARTDSGEQEAEHLYKRKKYRTPDSLAQSNQGKILFTEDDDNEDDSDY